MVFQNVKCVCDGVKGIHEETFVNPDAYFRMQNENSMNMWILESYLQDCQNSLFIEKEKSDRNIREKYFEICNLIIEYVQLYSYQKNYEQKLLNSIERLISYLNEDLQSNNLVALKDTMKFIFSLLCILRCFFRENINFEKILEKFYNLNLDSNCLSQDECRVLEWEAKKYCNQFSIKEINFLNPIREIIR